ncbi:hypothetical protein Tco_0848143 [Tanacetum coccineum]
MAPLLPRKERHPFLRYHGIEYNDANIADFEERGPLVRELILEFLNTLEVLLDLDAPALGLHTREEMGSPGFAKYDSESERMIPWKGDLHDYWRSISIDGDFLGPPPTYTLIRDPVLRLCHMMIAHSTSGRSQAPEKFVARLAEHFILLIEERLQGLTMIIRELPVINMAELVRLQICEEIGDTWAWVALRLKRQPDDAAGASGAAKDALVINEGDQAILAPVQAPQQPPPLPPVVGRTMPQRMGRLEEEVQGSWRLAGKHIRHSMGPSEGAHLQHSRYALESSLAVSSTP